MIPGLHHSRGPATAGTLRQIIHTVLRWGGRLVLLAAGLVFAASALVMVLLMLAWWVARVAWLKLTGRPVVPFVVRVAPRDAFRRAWPQRTGARADDRVVDVEARPLP